VLFCTSVTVMVPLARRWKRSTSLALLIELSG
jgi:hypothetical protein